MSDQFRKVDDEHLAEELTKLMEQKVPFEMYLVLGPVVEDADTVLLMTALSDFNLALNGVGLEFVELKSERAGDLKIESLAVCPAIPDDEP